LLGSILIRNGKITRRRGSVSIMEKEEGSLVLHFLLLYYNCVFGFRQRFGKVANKKKIEFGEKENKQLF
jgi:hypothetical protein